jgi:hypothetical protein
MFELDGAQVTWPYSVRLFGGRETEQIDGSVRFGGLHWLIECKDEKEDVAVDPIAKLRNQLLRRPSGTVGLVFTTTKLLPFAKTQPKEQLKLLFGQGMGPTNIGDLLDQLTAEDVEKLRSASQMGQLIAFIERNLAHTT